MVCGLEGSPRVMFTLSQIYEERLTPVLVPAWLLGFLIAIVKMPSGTLFNVAVQYHWETETPGIAGGTSFGSIVKWLARSPGCCHDRRKTC